MTLIEDVIFANRTAFLTISARKIKFVTTKKLPNRTAEQISKDLNKVIKLYGQGAFAIHVILMATDFKKV